MTTAEKARHVHVAASLFHDAAPARELGLKTVWINRLGEVADRARARAARPLDVARHARRARPRVTLRPPRDDDFDAMLELMNAHQLVAFGEADYTADDLRTWLRTPSVDVERDIRVLEQDGRLIGYADADPTREEPPLWWCDVKVEPTVNADEVVAELWWLEERAGQGGYASGRRPTGGSSTRSRARVRANPALVPDGDRPRGRARRAGVAGRDHGPHGRPVITGRCTPP